MLVIVLYLLTQKTEVVTCFIYKLFFTCEVRSRTGYMPIK